MDLFQILQRLYASEINCGLSSFWDAGWVVWLGDDINGRKAEEAFSNRDNDIDAHLREAADWLHEQALLHYPDSDYAAAFKDAA